VRFCPAGFPAGRASTGPETHAPPRREIIMAYQTTRHVGYAGRIRDPGTSIAFMPGDEAIRDRLLELCAIVKVPGKGGDDAPPAPAGDAKKAGDPPTDKALADQTLDELVATAKAEKVKGWGPLKGDADKLRARIEAHRAARAKG
jgi:hypothetical protein